MNDVDSQAIFGIFILICIVVAPLVIWCTILFIRWLFRINEIANSLTRIADKLAPLPSPPSESFSSAASPALLETTLKTCDCCHRLFEPYELETIGIGKTVCLDCKKFIQSK